MWIKRYLNYVYETVDLLYLNKVVLIFSTSSSVCRFYLILFLLLVHSSISYLYLLYYYPFPTLTFYLFRLQNSMYEQTGIVELWIHSSVCIWVHRFFLKGDHLDIEDSLAWKAKLHVIAENAWLFLCTPQSLLGSMDQMFWSIQPRPDLSKFSSWSQTCFWFLLSHALASS